MTPAKKGVYPGTGGEKRKRAKTARMMVMRADVTPDEKETILKHCIKNKISVSQFLANLALEDAREGNGEEQEFTFKLPREQAQKLLLMARLKDKSAPDFISELLLPPLANKQPHGSVEMDNLTMYVSEDEHETLKEHMRKKGISARNYIAILALEKIAKGSKSASRKEHKKKK